MRKGRMADHIPFEMQIEIMKRVPVKSLAVFRSVSKAWKSVIDSSLFIADHTNLRRHHRLLISYIIDYKYGYDIKYVSIMDNDTLSQHTVSNVPVSFETLVGTSHGLLCLSDEYREDGCRKKRAVIWNPSLGKSIAIHVPSKDYLESTVLDFGVHLDNFDPMIDDLGSEDDLNYTVLGFGVRPDNFDPMIVLINGVSHSIPVLVFTLSSRIWRIPRGNLPPKSIGFSYDTPVVTDRCIYWKASERSINLVVGFDMVSEVFTEINLPHCVAHQTSDVDLSISKIRESLALLEYDSDADKPVYGVWMMVEDGVSKSFTKLFTINTPRAPLETKVLGFRKNDQPIPETTKYRHSVSLKLYEPRTGTIKKTGINIEDGSSFLSSYTETLLLLDQLDKQVVTIQLQ